MGVGNQKRGTGSRRRHRAEVPGSRRLGAHHARVNPSFGAPDRADRGGSRKSAETWFRLASDADVGEDMTLDDDILHAALADVSPFTMSSRVEVEANDAENDGHAVR
jgi:hypothetical protein